MVDSKIEIKNKIKMPQLHCKQDPKRNCLKVKALKILTTKQIPNVTFKILIFVKNISNILNHMES